MIDSYSHTSIEEKEVNKIMTEKLNSDEWIKITEGYSACAEDEYYRDEKGFYCSEGNTRNQAKAFFASQFSIPYTEVKVRREPHLDVYRDEEGNKVGKFKIYDEKYKEGLDKFLEEYKGRLCHIRTDNGFWGYNHCGYTYNTSKAGIYSVEEGYNVLCGCGRDKQGALYVIDKDDLEGYIEPLEEHLKTLKSWRVLVC